MREIKILLVFVVVVIAGSVSGCSVGSSPAGTVKMLFRAMEKGDLEGMRKCYVGPALEAFSNMCRVLDSSEYRAGLKERMQGFDELVIGDIERIGSRATVKVRIGAGGGEEEIFRLTRQGFGWKITG